MGDTIRGEIIALLGFLFCLNLFMFLANTDYYFSGSENQNLEKYNFTTAKISDAYGEMADTDDMNLWKAGKQSFTMFDILLQSFTFGGFTGFESGYFRLTLVFFLQILPLLIVIGAMLDYVRGK